MGQHSNLNAEVILQNIENAIAELESIQGSALNPNHDRYFRTSWKNDKYAFKINAVYKELSIFDWWGKTLSLSQLKQMKNFVKSAIKLGFTGYTTFKVGEKGCSHGMWVAKEESEDGYNPDCDTLFHSFRNDTNYYDVELNGKWMSKLFDKKYDELKLDDIKRILEIKEFFSKS